MIILSFIRNENWSADSVSLHSDWLLYMYCCTTEICNRGVRVRFAKSVWIFAHFCTLSSKCPLSYSNFSSPIYQCTRYIISKRNVIQKFWVWYEEVKKWEMMWAVDSDADNVWNIQQETRKSTGSQNFLSKCPRP